MTLRADATTSRLAYRSLWLMALVLQLVLVAVALHRLGWLATPVALNLIAVGMVGTAIAAVLGLAALVGIWKTGRRGTAAACASLVLAGLFFVWPAYLISEAVSSPALNDISTDAQDPPAFAAAAGARGYGANPLAYAAATYAPLQQAAYPDIGPVITPRPASEAFAIVREVVKKAGLEIVAEQPPGRSREAGRIEASETTLVMGFVDDITIRIAGDDRFSRIDLRSQSRYGLHDLGRNAQRIRGLIKDLHMSLDASAPATEVAAVDPEDAGADDGSAASRKKVKKRAKKSSEASEAQDTQRDLAQPSAQRAQGQKEKPRKRAARRARDIQNGVLRR
jgi:uncharacterized protein (DUF1499 family)